MKNIFNNWIILVLIPFVFQSANAQEINIINQYQSARSFYAAGRLDTTISLLETCFDNPKSFRQVSWGNKVEIYRLAAISYFLDYKSEKATQYVQELVKLDPDYRNNFREDDIAQFKAEVNSLDAIPSFKLGIHSGANFTSVSVLKDVLHIIETQGTSKKIYEGAWGYTVGIKAEYTLGPSFMIRLNTGLRTANYAFNNAAAPHPRMNHTEPPQPQQFH